jgi:cob(I)alamin adenosyltransferase
MRRKGFVHVYTGDGKGKTTAAIGLLVRACGAGMKVYLGQFFKRGDSSEIAVLRARFPEVIVETCGRGRFIRGKPAARDVAAARRGLRRLRAAMLSGEYGLVIADEACPAVRAGLLAAGDLVRVAKDRPDGVELVFTGRGAPRALVTAADLVTDMRQVRHYYDRGAPARAGIEM